MSKKNNMPSKGHKVHNNLDAEISSTLYDDFDKFERLFATKIKFFCWAGAIIVLIVAVWGISTWSYEKNLAKRVNALNSADSVETLITAIDKYGDGILGNDARMRLADLLILADNYTDAIAQLDAIIATDCPIEQSVQMELNRAYLLEKAGKIAEATQAFVVIGGNVDFASPDTLAQANFNAGRLYASAGDNTNAVKYLEMARSDSMVSEVISGQQDPFWRAQASALLNELNK